MLVLHNCRKSVTVTRDQYFSIRSPKYKKYFITDNIIKILKLFLFSETYQYCIAI